MLELRCLGSVDLRPSGEGTLTSVLRQPKRFALLAYLAIMPRAFHRRDTLLAVFWPDLDQDHARAALRNALHFLRRHVGDQVLLTRGDELGVNREILMCDVTDFNAALDQGDLGRALALYRGAALEGLHVEGAPEFEQWLDGERRRLSRKAHDAARSLARVTEHAGDAPAAASWLRLALTFDPEDEVGLQHLMRVMDLCGDRAGALRQYERFAGRMADEFALQPSARSQALVREIRGRAASIVVLPFINLGADFASDHFSDGLTEEVILDLSRVPFLRVISQPSSMLLKREATRNVREIGVRLNVEYALEGSIRRDEDSLRVIARLTDTDSGAVRWTERYTGSRSDVFDIQQRLVRAVLSNMALPLAEASVAAPLGRHAGSVTSYDCYHRAIQELGRYSERGLDSAAQHVRNGLAVVGENDLLLATMGYVCIQYLELGIKPENGYLEQAADYAARALRLNARSCLACVVEGLISFKRGDIERAVGQLRRALTIDPHHRDALLWLSLVYLIAGREVAARPLLTRLLDIDPLTPVNHCLPGYAEFLQGNFEAALPWYEKMHTMEPDNPTVRWFLALVLGRVGHAPEALVLLDAVVRDAPGTTIARHATFLSHALRGQYREARHAATTQLQREARWDQHASWWMAATYSLIDDHASALDWLSNATRLGYINYPFLSTHDPFLEGLRSDERFWQLMAVVKDRWERLKV
jgi:TolB-like protein/tetratricopeptide (TPR) repeat protein